MIKFALVVSTITFLGCSSVQQQTFSLSTDEEFKLKAAKTLEFSTLCEQLSIIAFMNLLDKDPADISNQDEGRTSCSFSGSQTHSGYSFGFTYQSPDDTEYAYSDHKYLNKTSYTKSELELNAVKTNNAIDILRTRKKNKKEKEGSEKTKEVREKSQRQKAYERIEENRKEKI